MSDGTSTINQHDWGASVIATHKASLWSSLPDNHNRARLLAVPSLHPVDWLHALPLASCETKLDNEAIRVAVGLCLVVNLCELQTCPCGTLVNANGSHGLSSKRSTGRSICHHQLKHPIWRALTRASIPSIKEPTGLCHSDGKRSAGVSLFPWLGGQLSHLGLYSGRHTRSHLLFLYKNNIRQCRRRSSFT